MGQRILRRLVGHIYIQQKFSRERLLYFLISAAAFFCAECNIFILKTYIEVWTRRGDARMAEFGLKELLRFFPERLRAGWENSGLDFKNIREIRLRADMPVRVQEKEEIKLPMCYGERELEDIFRYLCRDSVYAYDGERRQGYMTVEGGHRIGITGELEPSEKGGFLVKYVRYMNIRIAHQIKNVANSVMPFLCNGENTFVYNVLIVSPPGIGKTTLLRDIIRQVSDGFGTYKGCNVGVVDERGELAGAYRGKAMLDCGGRTDIVTGGDKLHGIDILVRTFSPSVVAIDEIGKAEDADAILHAGVSGCSVLATVHGSSIEDIRHKGEMDKILQWKLFERFVVLGMKKDRYFSVYDKEGKLLCGKSLLQAHLS